MQKRILDPAGNYLLKVNSRNTRTTCIVRPPHWVMGGGGGGGLSHFSERLHNRDLGQIGILGGN